MNIPELRSLRPDDWIRVPLVQRRGKPWSRLRWAVREWQAWLAERQAMPSDNQLACRLATAAIDAAAAGKPFCRFGPERGLYEHRQRLPAPFPTMGRTPFRAVVTLAINSGRLVRKLDGSLVAPDQV